MNCLLAPLTSTRITPGKRLHESAWSALRRARQNGEHRADVARGMHHRLQQTLTVLAQSRLPAYARRATIDVTMPSTPEQTSAAAPWPLSDPERVHGALLETQNVLVLDHEGFMVFVNERAAQLLGRPVSAVLGAHALEFMDQQGRLRARKLLERRRHELPAQWELAFQRTDGTTAWVMAAITALEDEPTGRAAILLILTDISVLKVAEARLMRSLEELERQSEARCAELRETSRRLGELATRDPLTGLLNRRALETRLSEEASRAQRHGFPLSLLMIDIDHFKNINDSYGHLTGDHVLCSVARALLAHVRVSDVVARFGGEEFLILAPHTPHGGALVLAERLRAAMAESTSPAQVTISIGVAELGQLGLSSGIALIEKADQALYRAKQQGRNRVCVPAE